MRVQVIIKTLIFICRRGMGCFNLPQNPPTMSTGPETRKTLVIFSACKIILKSRNSCSSLILLYDIMINVKRIYQKFFRKGLTGQLHFLTLK